MPLRFFPFLILAILAPAASAAPIRYDAKRNAAVFDKAWSLVEWRYWDPAMRGVDWEAARVRFRPQALAARDEEALYAVLDRMLGALHDSHVYAVPPSERPEESEHPFGGEASGLGFDAMRDKEGWRIASVEPESPAARAGIGIGWRLLTVDGSPVDPDRPPAREQATMLSLIDGHGARRQVNLRPATFPIAPDLAATRLPNGLLLLRLNGFDRGADAWFVRQIAARPAGLILDLRENDGGESEVLDRIAGALSPERSLVLRLSGRRSQDEQTRGAGASSYRGPVAVLIGPRTASAAEALAAFLDETGRATTIGERTAGHLTGGVHHRLPDGGELTLAEYDVRTPNGERLEGVGLAPRHAIGSGPGDPALAYARALLTREAASPTRRLPYAARR